MTEPTARWVALTVLNDVGPGSPFAGDRLDTALARHALTPADRRLATELVYGVLRRRGTIDALLGQFLAHSPAPRLFNLLRLGAYQLAFLDHIPAHAAINTAVDLAPAARAPRGRGLVNAVLRGLTRILMDERTAIAAPDSLPLADGSYRRLSRPVFPDPANDPAGYLASAFGLPAWLSVKWLARLGFEEAKRWGFWFNAPPPLWLRVNPLKVSRDDYLQQLVAQGVTAEAGEPPQSIRLLSHAAVRSLPGYDAGWFTVQDESAQRIAALLNPLPGWRILDRCAAPGGKSTHLAELIRDQGTVIATDVDERKVGQIQRLARGLGLTSVTPTRCPRGCEPPPGPFDAALVDAPCSNTGVLGRRPEVRNRLRPEDVVELADLQVRLLTEAIDRVRPGGVVVYSTCSIEPEENESVVRRVTTARPTVRLIAELTSTPGLPSDGGYRARLEVAS